MRASLRARIIDYDITGFVGEAFTKIAGLERNMNLERKLLARFKCTGIYPLDRNIFSDIDYLGC